MGPHWRERILQFSNHVSRRTVGGGVVGSVGVCASSSERGGDGAEAFAPSRVRLRDSGVSAFWRRAAVPRLRVGPMPDGVALAELEPAVAGLVGPITEPPATLGVP